MGKIIFDYGHGGKDSGASYKGRLEKDDNLQLGKDVKRELMKHGVKVDETRSGDYDLSLQRRCDIANRFDYDYFISFHRNAFDTHAEGVEVFTHTTQATSAIVLASNVLNNLVKVGFKNRGVKTANFKVLRSTKANAILIETGFIDNDNDNKIYDDRYAEIVEGITKAILKTLGVENNKPVQVDDVFFRVVTGSFRDRKNAEIQVEKLKQSGFNSFIDVYRG